jgi:hypothetical protein
VTEEWRDIPSLPGYQASSDGRIRSIDRVITNGRGHYKIAGVVRQLTRSRSGYLRFNVTGGTRAVHLAVLEAFVGARPPGCQGAHGDGDRTNNRPSNLRWATPIENAADKELHGTTYRPKGEGHPGAKLTNEVVVAILRRYAAGERQCAIARDLGLDARLVGKVARGEAWRHVAHSAQHGVAFSGEAEAA